MNNIYIYIETYTNGYIEFITSLVFFTSILSGIFVIVSKNPIISVLFLIGLFLSIAIYLMILGVSFIGLSYLLVYIGAVSILFLFILMLINIRISELLSETSKSIPLAIFIAIAFNYPIFNILPYILSEFINKEENIYSNIINIIANTYSHFKYKISFPFYEIKIIYFVTSSNWDSNLSEISDITNIGNIMYSNYSIWLIITSIILLLAMVGAIVITIKQKDTSKYIDKYNKLYSDILKGNMNIKALSIFMVISIGDFRYKTITSYDFSTIKLEMNNLLNSTISNLSNNIDTISNINFNLIDKINIKPDINFNLIDNINTIPKGTIKSFYLEDKFFYISDLSIDYVYNNIYLPINNIIINYPQYLILPIISILLSIVLPVTNPNNTNTVKSSANKTDKGESSVTYSETKITKVINFGANTSGNNGGEDPNKKKENVFFLLKDKKKIPVPFYLYKEYIDNLDMFIKTRTSLKDKFHLLRHKISNYLTSGGKLSLRNAETGEINEVMKNFLDFTEDDRKEITELINQYILWQIVLQESMDKIANIHQEINNNFHKSIELINIGVHEMSYYSLDNNLYDIIEENIGIIFSIIDISPYTSNFNMAYDPIEGSYPINSTTPVDPFTFDEISSIHDMVALLDASELIFDTNLDSEIYYHSDDWEYNLDINNEDNIPNSNDKGKGKEIIKEEDKGFEPDIE
jgi:NADH-ubiquinone oxidoreductase chain 6